MLSRCPPLLRSFRQLRRYTQRAVDNVDVCIVGAGPAGLATAIRLKQRDNDSGSGSLRVIVLEKAADFGSHTVSGAVVEPRAFRELFPEKDEPLPAELTTQVTHDHMRFLTLQFALPLPEPPQMANRGNYIVLLSAVVAHLAEEAAELGVEMYPGVSVSEVLYSGAGAVKGVATRDVGIGRDGRPKETHEPGMEFHARVTVLGEGCHGLLTKHVLSRFGLRNAPQTYGLGVKEVWRVQPEKFDRGYVGHTMGYPLGSVYGGGFMYHFGDGLVAVGLVAGLDYKNPYLSPYQEFQRMKLHPYYADVLEGGECVSYAARALNEGGLQLVPRLHFPGGVLVGCSAGFVNVPKVKGTHTAVKLGMVAAEAIFDAIGGLEPVDDESDMEAAVFDLKLYEDSFKETWAWRELEEVRNVRPSFAKFGFLGGLAYSGFTTMLTRGHEPWTLQHTHTDSAATEPALQHSPIAYAKPDNKLTFDILTLVLRTGTYHEEDEECHLRLRQSARSHTAALFPKYKGVELRFCPAGVYEYVEDAAEPEGVRFQINSQNCIHCKTCDIKVPQQDIDWTVPEGGGGPKYYMT